MNDDPLRPYPTEPYPPQQYPQEHYPPQGGYYPYPPQPMFAAGPLPPPPGQNGFAIAALVLSLVGGVLLSVIFGIVALTKVRKTGQAGKGMAIAALAISGVWLLVIAAGAIVALNDDSTSVSADRVHAGDCIKTMSEADTVYRLPLVPCAQPHQGEVFGEFDLPGGGYPGEAAIDSAAGEQCATLLDAYTTRPVDSTLDLMYLYPRSGDWRRGDRTVVCIAYSEPQRTGSLR